jgi:site-specific recombinase XerD
MSTEPIMKNGKELPDGIVERRVSERTGLVTLVAEAGMVCGVRIRRLFGKDYETELEALAAAKYWLKQKRAEIKNDRKTVIAMSDRERAIYAFAHELVEPYGKNLIDAAQAAVKLWEEEKKPKPAVMTFKQAGQKFLKFKRLEGIKESYLRDLQIRLNALRGLDDMSICEVATEDIVDFLETRDLEAISWNNWRRTLAVFFNFCVAEELIEKSPIERVPLKKLDDEEVEILSVEDARKLLKAAREYCPRQIPWLALGLFGGLRRSEADQVKGDDIDWETESIKVNGAKNRSVSTRYVHLTEAARTFLEPYGSAQELVTLRRTRREDLRLLAAKTGLGCTRNLYRHSFGSYHNALYKDRAKTMHEMGHYEPSTFVKWYRKPIPNLVAEAYWSIRPENL